MGINQNLARNSFKTRLHERLHDRSQDKNPAVGIWLSLASGVSADIAAGSGLDWALIDWEHSTADFNSILLQFRALEGSGVAPLVRAPWNDRIALKRLLDAGAHSLMIPMIETAAEAERAVSFTRYPPHGVRGVAAAVRSNNFGRVTDYYDRIHEEICLIAQIETELAVENLESILAVDGIHAVFLGPSDLAASMGHIGEPGNAAVRGVISDCVRISREHAKPVGTLAGKQQPVDWCLATGFDFVAIGSDTGLLAAGLEKALGSLGNR